AGQSILQELGVRAKANNITVKGFVQFTAGKKYYYDELKTIMSYKPQTVIVQAVLTDGVRIMVSASNMTLLNGDIWWVLAHGFGPTTFSSQEELDTLAQMKGVWQVYGRKGLMGEYAEFEKYWYNSFNSDGSMIINGTGANCNLNIPFARGCMGSGNGIVGALPELIKVSKLNAAIETDYWFAMCMGCIEIIARTLDYYIKNGTLSIADIIGRKALTNAAAGNITTFLNTPKVPDYWGKTWKFDKNGDGIFDISIINYYYNTARNRMWIREVGVWDVATDTITMTNEEVFYLANRTGPPRPPPTPTNQYQAKMPLRYAFDGLVALCSAISLALAGAMMFYIKQRIFKASSPIFLALIVVGANISFVSVWLFSQYPMTSSSCIIYGWLKYVGFAFVFGSLIVKTYRIFVIFTTKKKGKQNLSDPVLLTYFGVLVAIWVAILLVWTIVPSQRPFLDAEVRYKLDSDGAVASVEVTPFCNFTSYNYVCLAAMVLTLVYGVFLAYSVRNTPGAFNESKWIAYSIYNWVVIGIVLNAIANFAVSNPDIIFVMEALVVIITQTGVCGFMIAPKLYVISQGQGDEIETFNSSTSSQNKSTRTGGTSSINNAAAEKELENLKIRVQGIEGENAKLTKIANEKQAEIDRLMQELAKTGK
ncbi:Gamma-aminobutyric acid type B receptor subunit 2, partial [Phlyctochytrium planicorne]